jgi:hypothetical protein
LRGNSYSDDHSELVPLLPIPNRTVKRLSADDSVDYPCESRTSSDSYKVKRPAFQGGAFYFVGFSHVLLEVLTKHAEGVSCGEG